jgi:hypothetical protein
MTSISTPSLLPDFVQDEHGTHFTWTLESVTPRMIDWFWSNMEKAMLLWHPEEHEPLTWVVPPQHGNPLGSVHLAPQTWSDGTRQNLYIRMERLDDVPAEVKRYVEYAHCVIVGGLGFDETSLEAKTPFGYRVHQWEATDAGVRGRSSAISGTREETRERGRVWAAHARAEIGNWEVFLPDLYRLYRVVANTAYNPYADLSVEGQGQTLRYTFIP